MELEVNRIIETDAITGLRALPEESIDCVLTSPPYWSSRAYGNSPTKWKNGEDAALGEEKGLHDYLQHLLEVFDEVKRVLKKQGTLWVNLGDVYCGSWGNYSAAAPVNDRALPSASVSVVRWQRSSAPDSTWRPPTSFKQPALQQKSLCLIPHRFAVAMCERGWILRNHIVWYKPNHMPSSVKDRLTPSWESLFFFVKDKRYAFDLDAIRVPHKSSLPVSPKPAKTRISHNPKGNRLPPHNGEANAMHPKGKNPADCWSIATHGGKRDHPAVFPERLCERPILAGCPSLGIVLDPFMGSGTTAVVAERLGRRWLGFEQNPRYVRVSRERLRTCKPSDYSLTI